MTVKYPTDPNKEIPKPTSLTKMVELAENLSKDLAHVRTDFYSIGNKIYFGELTFYPESGFAKFTPSKFEITMGEWINIT